MQYNEYYFWIYPSCTVCGYQGDAIYKPDLLNGPINMVCKREKVAIIPFNYKCSNRWSVALDDTQKEILTALIGARIAKDEACYLYEKIVKEVTK